MDDDRLLTVTEVAEWLRVHPETVRLWLRDGVLRGFMPGGKRSGYRVRESELRRFMAEREEQGKAAAGPNPAAA
jgi:excisionase family DNA binding protein